MRLVQALKIFQAATRLFAVTLKASTRWRQRSRTKKVSRQISPSPSSSKSMVCRISQKAFRVHWFRPEVACGEAAGEGSARLKGKKTRRSLHSRCSLFAVYLQCICSVFAVCFQFVGHSKHFSGGRRLAGLDTFKSSKQ